MSHTVLIKEKLTNLPGHLKCFIKLHSYSSSSSSSSSSSPLFILGLHILANGLFSTWPRPYTKLKKVYIQLKELKQLKSLKTVLYFTV